MVALARTCPTTRKSTNKQADSLHLAFLISLRQLQQQLGAVYPIGQVAGGSQHEPVAAAAAFSGIGATDQAFEAHCLQQSRTHSHAAASSSGGATTTRLPTNTSGLKSADCGTAITRSAAAAHNASEVLHLSLSRTLPLRFHLVPTLVQELVEQLASTTR